MIAARTFVPGRGLSGLTCHFGLRTLHPHSLPSPKPVRWWRTACLAAAVWSAWPLVQVQAQARLPSLGDSVSEDFDIGTEKRLGDRIMRDLRQDPDFLDDPQLSEYVDSLWQPLLQAARSRGEISADIDALYGWDTFQVADRSINAFALPGGHVGVNLGLIAMTGSSDELASVLAHELTHVTQRHIARGMVNSQRQGMASLAALVVGVLVASKAKSADAANAVIVGTQAAAMQGQINFTREMEREADRIGLQLMGTAGFAASGMATMFEKMEVNGRLNDSNAFPYLRSHPLTIERISDARLRMNSAPGSRPPSLAWHSLMQARARVLMDPREPSLRLLQSLGAAGSPAVTTTRLGNLYSAALASIQLREFDKARAPLQAGADLARSQFGSEPQASQAFALLQLDLQRRTDPLGGTLSNAIAPIAKDSSRPALLARAQAAQAWQRAGDPAAPAVLRSSLEDLQTWVTEHAHDALAWKALSQCAQVLGLRLRALRADAEASAAGGDVIGAVDRFRTAQRIAKEDPGSDYVESSIIQSRLRELEVDRRKLMAELRGERVD
jgi:beta-barrel assembly-enhancing protease